MEFRELMLFMIWHANSINLNHDTSSTWLSSSVGRIFSNYMSRFSNYILVPHFKPTSVFGFALLLNMMFQVASGFLLAILYMPDPTMVMTLREEYMNEIWWFSYVYKTHVMGVDSIFVLSYLHIFKKVYMKNFVGASLEGWVSGTYAFLVYHMVVFLGITLSSNHLGDLTLTIASNIFWSILGYEHKAYAAIFTNQHLNIEQLTSFMIAHYCAAWYYLYLVQNHVMYIHEMWDLDSGSSTPQDGSTPKSSWGFDAVQSESAMMLFLYIFLMTLFTKQNHPDRSPVNFNFFEQWAEVEMEDMNFFMVGPHWYFSPHMGLLTLCGKHYEGIMWLLSYYVVLALLPLWSSFAQHPSKWSDIVPDSIPMSHSLTQRAVFVLFICSMLYLGGTLPCARFYYEGEEGFFGNLLLKLSYQFIYTYLLVVLHWLDSFESWVCATLDLRDNDKKVELKMSSKANKIRPY